MKKKKLLSLSPQNSKQQGECTLLAHAHKYALCVYVCMGRVGGVVLSYYAKLGKYIRTCI